MIRHSTKIAIESLLGALVVVAVLAVAFVWRLSEGPISLDAFKAQVAAALEDEQRGLSVSMESLVLTWDGREKRPDLRALGLRIDNDEGLTVVDLPLVAVRLSVGALLRGEVAVSQVDVIGVALDLIRREDGSLDLDAARPLDTERIAGSGAGSEIDDIILSELSSRPEERAESPLAALQQVRVIGARMTLTDLSTGTVWRAPQAFLTLRRIEQGLSADVALGIDVAGSLTRIDAQMAFDRDSRQLDTAIEFSGLRPPALFEALDSPDLQQLEEIDIEISGSLAGQMTTRGKLISAAATLSTGPGSISLPALGMDRIPLRGIALGAGIDMMEGRVNLRSLEVRLGEESGPVITASARVNGLSTNIFEQKAAPLVIDADFALDRVHVDELERYWPPQLADGGRRWVTENITAGRAFDLSGRVGLRSPEGDPNALELTVLEGGFSYEGLQVHYLRPLPPAEGIAGRASFAPDALRFSAESGEIAGLASGNPITVSQGSIDITDLQAEDQFLTVEHRAAGSVADLLALLDQPSLALISKLGLSQEGVEGAVEGQLFFRFPLLDDLTLEEIEMRAEADVTGGALDQVVLGQDLSDGNLKLAVTLQEMRLSGDGALGGVPMSFDWEEYFEGRDGLRRKVAGSVPAIGPEGIASLGLDTDPYLEGDVAGDFDYRERLDGFSEVALALDLEAARLAVPVLLDWEKPAGQGGRASLSLEMQDFRPRSLKGIDVSAGSLSLSGDAFFDEAGEALERAQLSTVAFGDQSLWGVTLLQRGERFELLAEGGLLDVEPFMALEDGPGEAPDQKPEDSASDDSNFSILVKDLEQVRFAPGRYVEAASLELERLPDGWRRVLVTGSVPPELRSAQAAGSQIRIDYGPAGEGRAQVLSVTAEDAGGLFRAVDFLDTMQGGRLSITGRRADRAWETPLVGDLLIEEFKLVDAPVLARILTLASLTGILNVLGGEGITFEKVTGAYSAERGKLSTELMRAYGPAIGLTAEGSVDLDADAVSVNGTVVPAYSVNRVLGAIPLLGDILTGGEGEGVFAVTYGVSGPIENLDVSVNPLSVLAPGFLRNLFEVDPDAEAAPGAQEDRELPERGAVKRD